MRRPVDITRLRTFFRRFGRGVRGEGGVYVTGGGTALLHGWREQTVDIDIKLDPEPAGAFEAIQTLKEELQLNIELASPDLFLPALDGWRDRSALIVREGQVEFRHYDYYAQALAKVERGHGRDLADVRAMLDRGLVQGDELRRHLDAMEGRLARYPAVDPPALRRRLEALLAD